MIKKKHPQGVHSLFNLAGEEIAEPVEEVVAVEAVQEIPVQRETSARVAEEPVEKQVVTQAPVAKNVVNAAPLALSGTDAVIHQHGSSEWRNDARMYDFCADQQYDALKKLALGKPGDISQADFNVVREKCQREWPTDYNMQAYCEKQQYDAVRTLNQTTSSRRSKCAGEWPSDFNMREFCESQDW